MRNRNQQGLKKSKQSRNNYKQISKTEKSSLCSFLACKYILQEFLFIWRIYIPMHQLLLTEQTSLEPGFSLCLEAY